MGEPRRWFIGAATTTYTTEYREACSEDDRPELRNELERMRELFSGLGYLLVPGFKADLDRDDFRALLRSFLTDADRTEDDTVVVYYTGHGVMDGAELLLPMADATADAEFTSLPAAELTGRLISGGAVKVRRLLVLLDTCYAGGAMEGFAGGAIGFLNRLRVPKTPHRSVWSSPPDPGNRRSPAPSPARSPMPWRTGQAVATKPISFPLTASSESLTTRPRNGSTRATS